MMYQKVQSTEQGIEMPVYARELTFGGKLTNAEMKNAASKIKIEKKVLIIEERFEKFV